MTAYQADGSRWLDVSLATRQARVRDVYDLSDMSSAALQDLDRIRSQGLARPTIQPRELPTRQP